MQVLPAMWIWAAMLDLKAHALHGKEFHLLRGPLLWLVLLVIAEPYRWQLISSTRSSRFAISKTGAPEIRPAFTEAKRHIRTIVAWGFLVGLPLGVATTGGRSLGKVLVFADPKCCGGGHDDHLCRGPGAVHRSEVGAFHTRQDHCLCSGRSGRSGGVHSAIARSGRFAILLLGSHTFRYLAIVMLAIAVVLQTGATSSIKAIKMTAKLAVGRNLEEPKSTTVDTA